jgi:hypothetical protein
MSFQEGGGTKLSFLKRKGGLLEVPNSILAVAGLCLMTQSPKSDMDLSRTPSFLG